MKTLACFGVITCMLGVAALAATGYPHAKITIKVVDEESNPVPEATVGIGFPVASKTHFGNEEIAVRGPSNTAGEFTGAANADAYLGYTVRKSGYYATTGNYRFKENVSGKWQPWNPTVEVVLKKIVQPIPMYVRPCRIVLPVVGEPVGFDLMAGDLVAPHGKGQTSDFVFLLHRNWKSQKEFDAQLTLTFSNKNDGIQAVTVSPNHGSELKLPRTAPEAGYEPQFVLSKSRAPGKAIQTNGNEERSFLFRVRSILNTKGAAQGSHYGKVQGDITMDVRNSNTAIVRFTYYLNPTPNDRTLEFDPANNLFRDLPDNETVEAP